MRKIAVVMVTMMLCSLFVFTGCGTDDSGKLTLEKYNKIENGMTYDEVKDIIGSEGTVGAESGEKGSEYYTVIYQYEGKGSVGANASFTFQGSPLKLQSKAQAGLK